MNNLCFDTAGLRASLHTATLDKYLTPLAMTFTAKQNHLCYKATENLYSWHSTGTHLILRYCNFLYFSF